MGALLVVQVTPELVEVKTGQVPYKTATNLLPSAEEAMARKLLKAP
jgi:hypothetical protein